MGIFKDLGENEKAELASEVYDRLRTQYELSYLFKGPGMIDEPPLALGFELGFESKYRALVDP